VRTTRAPTPSAVASSAAPQTAAPDVVGGAEPVVEAEPVAAPPDAPADPLQRLLVAALLAAAVLGAAGGAGLWWTRDHPLRPQRRMPS
jgi:hypothetical protein